MWRVMTEKHQNIKINTDAAKHKAIVHQLDFIGAFLQANVKDRVFVKLDKRY